MSRGGWAAAAILGLFLGSAPALASCDEDSIDTVSEDGDLIVLGSGTAYDVNPGDQPTVSLWIEGQSVLICDDTIINKDQNGERAEVTPH